MPGPADRLLTDMVLTACEGFHAGQAEYLLTVLTPTLVVLA